METHLYEQLYKHIVHEILQGKLKTGDRVSSEKELAEQFGVSRITSKRRLKSWQKRVLSNVSREKGHLWRMVILRVWNNCANRRKERVRGSVLKKDRSSD